MKKNSSKTNKEKKAVVEEKETQGKFTLNKKIIILICLVLIIIVITTLAIGILSKKQNTTILEAKKTNLNLQNNEHMHVELDASGDKVPVPNGYVGSKITGENEVNTGYVIYEGEEEVNDTNKDEAQKSRNQYVWIPVPDISKFYGIDSNGKKWGKIYNFTNGTSSDPLFDEVTGTYPLNWSESNGIMRKYYGTRAGEPELIIKSNNRSEIICDDASDSTLKLVGVGIKTGHEFLKQIELEFNSMIASVEKYGGFYIGRYETGNLGKESAVVQKGNIDNSGETWHTMYNKCKKLKGQNINVETGIIWGNQWDRTLIWLIESKNKTKEEICKNSTSWGNYEDATFEYLDNSGSKIVKELGHGVTIPTGSTEYTKANNIYDLVGNVNDFTIESTGSQRQCRGGYCFSTGMGLYPHTAAYRNNWSFPSGSGYSFGCRAMLYIK